jgi:hypothetical protein
MGAAASVVPSETYTEELCALELFGASTEDNDPAYEAVMRLSDIGECPGIADSEEVRGALEWIELSGVVIHECTPIEAPVVGAVRQGLLRVDGRRLAPQVVALRVLDNPLVVFRVTTTSPETMRVFRRLLEQLYLAEGRALRACLQHLPRG